MGTKSALATSVDSLQGPGHGRQLLAFSFQFSVDASALRWFQGSSNKSQQQQIREKWLMLRGIEKGRPARAAELVLKAKS
jgi:hypothetical protein